MATLTSCAGNVKNSCVSKFSPTGKKWLFAIMDEGISLGDRIWKTQLPIDISTLTKICEQICHFAKNKAANEFEIMKMLVWLVKSFKNCTDGSLHILNAIGGLLRHNLDFSQVIDDLVGKQGILLYVIDNESESNLEKVAALKCLLYLIYYHDNIYSHVKRTFLSKQQLNQCAKSLTRLLFKKKQKSETEETHCEVIIYSCKTLTKIYINDTEITKNLEDIIGACKYWMFYSLKDMKLEMPRKLAPSQQTIADIETKPIVKGDGRQRKLRRNARSVQVRDTVIDKDSNTHGYKVENTINDYVKTIVNSQSGMTSESDISDSEGTKEKNVSVLQAKLRISILNLLTIVVKTAEKHLVFGYWWAFLPDVESEKSNIGGLALMITLETTPSGRSAAFTVLLTLLTYSKLYLLQADTSKHMTMSFTPFSVALGNSLENIHKLLSLHLNSEKSIPVLVIILKCTAACIQATPYNKLGGDMLIPIVKIIHKLLFHKDWTVKVASLIVMGCVVSINPELEEISYYIFNGYEKETLGVSNLSIAEGNFNREQITSSKHENSNWLLVTCLKNFGWENNKIDVSKISILPTRLESLQVISAIAQRFFDALIVPSLSIITDALCISLEDNSTELCLHAAKCVGVIGEAIQSSELSKDESVFEKFCAFWTRLLHGSLTKLIQNESHTIARAAACDCLGTIGETILDKLDKKLKILMTTLLLGCSADEDSLVKVSALRALAICIVYQQWREDPYLISDCVETTLRIVAESSFSVKIKAVWALANVTDALLKNAKSSETEAIDNDSFYKLLEASLKASNENEKIKVNAVRAIGNLLLLMNDSHISNRSDVLNLTVSSIQKLEQCATHGNNMKMRWNASHALGKILKNSVLYKHLGKWQEKILESLCKIIDTCRNLKVCIHAASALCSPSDRTQYGSTYIKIWTSVMGCLNSIHQTDDFSEYQHKKTLTDQLCITVSHLTCLIMINDLIDLYNPLCFYGETVTKLLQEVIQRSEPQSATCSKLLDAAKYVTTELSTTNEKQTQSLVILQNMFIWDY